MKNIAVTGSKGFIGSNLVETLVNRRFNVFKIVRKGYNNSVVLTSYKGLIYNNLSFKKIDCIIHCAGLAHNTQGISDNSLKKANVDFTEKITKLAIKFNIKKIIFLSTIGIYGSHTNNRKPFNLNDQNNPYNKYTESKVIAEQYLNKISKSNKIKIVILRLPLVYGPGVAGSFKRLLEYCSIIPINPFASGSGNKSLLSISCLFNVIEKCIYIDKKNFLLLLIADNKDIDINMLISKIFALMDRKKMDIPFPNWLISLISKIFIMNKEVNKMLNNVQIDSENSLRILGLSPKNYFDNDMKKTVKYFLKK